MGVPSCCIAAFYGASPCESCQAEMRANESEYRSLTSDGRMGTGQAGDARRTDEESGNPYGEAVPAVVIAEEELVVHDEYIICFAPAFPDPYSTRTLKEAREFVREYGGEIRHRVVSEWRTVQ